MIESPIAPKPGPDDHENNVNFLNSSHSRVTFFIYFLIEADGKLAACFLQYRDTAYFNYDFWVTARYF